MQELKKPLDRHFALRDSVTLTFDLILIGGRGIVIDYPCDKFSNFAFSHFDFIVRTDRQKESHVESDADDRYTHTTISVSNKRQQVLYCWTHLCWSQLASELCNYNHCHHYYHHHHHHHLHVIMQFCNGVPIICIIPLQNCIINISRNHAGFSAL